MKAGKVNWAEAHDCGTSSSLTARGILAELFAWSRKAGRSMKSCSYFKEKAKKNFPFCVMSSELNTKTAS